MLGNVVIGGSLYQSILHVCLEISLIESKNKTIPFTNIMLFYLL